MMRLNLPEIDLIRSSRYFWFSMYVSWSYSSISPTANRISLSLMTQAPKAMMKGFAGLEDAIALVWEILGDESEECGRCEKAENKQGHEDLEGDMEDFFGL